jgi:hypothetical protein
VKRFISQAQVNYRSFFATTEPELFPKIIERLTFPRLPVYDVNSLQERFEKVHSSDKLNARFGLEPDRWDHGQIMAILNTFREKEQSNQNALTVLDAYAETLESRSAQRALVAERLRKFENLMSSFFGDKTVSIHPRDGFLIESDFHELLQERDLSSGEFHLLLLMVTALVTRRRGTVIAIDEPEMSMHLAWQRRLVPALVECASRANPLFIFATHSPDIAASYSQVLVELA